MSILTTVAIVDDNEAVLRSLDLTLNVLGIRPITFSCPRQALSNLSVQSGRLLTLTDLRMPGLSGDRLAVALKKAKPESHIIVMSGHAAGDDIEHLIPQVVSGFLPKPFNPTQFMEIALPWL